MRFWLFGTSSAVCFRHLRRLGVLMMVQTLFGGCVGGDLDPRLSVVRDSAGIRITELSDLALTPGHRVWRIGTEPSLKIGVREGEEFYQFSVIVGAVTLSDGRIVVLEGRTASKELRWFAPDGTHLSTAGGAGEGPGEFRSPGELLRLPGDTLLVRDGTISFPSLDFFNGVGEFIERIQPIPDLLPLSGPDGGIPAEVIDSGILLRDGTVLIQTFFMSTEIDPPPGAFRNPYRLLRVDQSGTEVKVDTIGRFQGVEFFTTDVGQGLVPFRIPFGAVEITASCEDRIYIVESLTGEVLAFDYGGELREIFRSAIPGRTITDEDYEREKEAVINFEPRYDNRAFVERLFRAIPHRTETPAVGGLMVDVDGNLWLERYRIKEDQPREWLVLGPDGSFQASVVGPAGFVPYEIGTDYVLGVWEDELGIPYVHRYPLLK
ncbi:hypothetical protein ACFL3S_11665 [Gemmatimonadota bacterium]